ncbi:MAG: hypothetical protein JWQ84_2163 [Mucilaginibacter sp.]|nr:hypothetical protein [Mucilaginibacter sp.]MDB5017331.1 hypothetical protein [Mucilaginibacter sp.]
MKSFPFDTINLEADEVQALEDTYRALKAKFNIGIPDNTDHFLNKFELFNNNPETKLGGTLFINYPQINCYLNFVKSSYSYSSGGRGGNGGQNFEYDKYQIWAFVTLNKDFGRVLIRPETFADRILEIFHPTELKFPEDKLFSGNFYVVANDPEKAEASITSDFRNVIIDMMYKDFVIEIINQTLVIRTNQPVNAEETVHLAEFASKISIIK